MHIRTVNALQNPPALHIACTRLTVPVIDDLLRDLRKAVDEVKQTYESGKGGMVTMCAAAAFFSSPALSEETLLARETLTGHVHTDGLGSSSAIGPGLVGEMAVRCTSALSGVCFGLTRQALTHFRHPGLVVIHRYGCGESGLPIASQSADGRPCLGDTSEEVPIDGKKVMQLYS